MLKIRILKSAITADYGEKIEEQFRLATAQIEVVPTTEEADFVIGMVDKEMAEVPTDKQILIKPEKPEGEIPKNVRWIDPADFTFWGLKTTPPLTLSGMFDCAQ